MPQSDLTTTYTDDQILQDSKPILTLTLLWQCLTKHPLCVLCNQHCNLWASGFSTVPMIFLVFYQFHWQYWSPISSTSGIIYPRQWLSTRGVIGSQIVNWEISSLVIDDSQCVAKKTSAENAPNFPIIAHRQSVVFLNFISWKKYFCPMLIDFWH